MLQTSIPGLAVTIKILGNEHCGILLSGKIQTTFELDKTISKWVDLSMFTEDDDCDYSHFSTCLNSLIHKFGSVELTVKENYSAF